MRRLRFHDLTTLAYAGLVACFLLWGGGERVGGWPWWLALHGLILGGVALLIRSGSAARAPRGLVVLRHFYPFLLLPFWYRESQHLNRLFVPHYLDAEVIGMEEWLFGFQPSLVLMEAWPWLWLSEILHAAYFSFYVMVLGMGIYLYLRKTSRFWEYLSVMTSVFYGCYLCFIFLPVIGPQLFMGPKAGYSLSDSLRPEAFAAYPERVQEGFFFQLMTFLYRHFEGAGGALPSSHVAAALATLFFSFRYVRPIRHAHLVVVMLLVLSTVYGRYHYAVDVLFGVVAAALLIPLGWWGHHRWEQARERGGSRLSDANQTAL